MFQPSIRSWLSTVLRLDSSFRQTNFIHFRPFLSVLTQGQLSIFIRNGKQIHSHWFVPVTLLLLRRIIFWPRLTALQLLITVSIGPLPWKVEQQLDCSGLLARLSWLLCWLHPTEEWLPHLWALLTRFSDYWSLELTGQVKFASALAQIWCTHFLWDIFRIHLWVYRDFVVAYPFIVSSCPFLFLVWRFTPPI